MTGPSRPGKRQLIPTDPEAIRNRIPDDWLEEHQGTVRVRSTRRKEMPRPIRIGTDASEAEIC